MSLVVRVVAPTGRDAQLITEVLQSHGLNAKPTTPTELLNEANHDHIGPLLIAEEALTSAFVSELMRIVQHQPAWSDLPILILTIGGRDAMTTSRETYERLPLGAPVLLERPIRTLTLVSSVRAALRARQRQYEIRDAFRARDQALTALKQERETLQAVLDNLPVGVLLAKPSGEVVLANRSIERICRHPPFPTRDIDSHGQWIAFRADGKRVKGEEFPLPRAMASGKAVPPEEYLYQRGDGTLGWINLSAAPIFNEAGEVTGGVVALSDIDHQKRTDSSLHRSDERFRRLIENSTVGLVIGDIDGGISYANPAILKLLGYTEDDVARGEFRWDHLTPTEFTDADIAAVEQLRTRGVAESYQKVYLARDGRRVPFLVGATVIPSQDIAPGRSSEVAVFLTDLSSQKQAEAALVQSEKLAAVGRLAASISHEINNPLEAVTNLLYLARHTRDLPDEAQELLDTADEELKRVSQIAAQTLRFHRQSTSPRRISPEELIGPTLALYNGRLSNSHIEVQLEHRGAGTILCYEGDIRQVLNNLIGNAIDAMRGGGRLVVRTSRTHLHEIEALPAVRISIADTGHGMTPDVMRRVCEPFYTTKGINGTGLGLWISRGIIDKHHGRMQICSRTGEDQSGTVFSLVLPTDAIPGAA